MVALVFIGSIPRQLFAPRVLGSHMIDLAVVNREETFERLQEPLADRGIAVHHLPVSSRTVPLTGEGPWDPETADVGFVYPGRHLEGAVATALLEIPWLNGRDAVLDSRNKAAVIARLERAGFPVPETVYVSSPVGEAELLAAFEQIGPPVVLKPNSTTRGRGVTRLADRDSLLGVADYLSLLHEFPATRDRSFLLQEFVPDATDYRVMVLEGEYVGAVTRSSPDGDGWKHNVHRGASARGDHPPSRVIDLAEAVAAELGIPFLGVDVLLTGDRTLVTETNARPTVDDPGKYERPLFDRLAAAIRRREED